MSLNAKKRAPKFKISKMAPKFKMHSIGVLAHSMSNRAFMRINERLAYLPVVFTSVKENFRNMRTSDAVFCL